MTLEHNEDEFWLFGYGSLIWKPPPHFDQRIPGYIEGYIRRFWQVRLTLLKSMGSPVTKSERRLDHRGTPEAPGRVVTLIDRAHYDTLVDHHFSAPDERVWGAAYHIPAEHVAEVKEYLDIREINGYSIQYTPFTPAAPPPPSSASSSQQEQEREREQQQKPLRCLVYIGLPDNPQFLGPQEPGALAAHILRSAGPSGPNREYLYNLEAALGALSAASSDGHVGDLAARCRALEAQGGGSEAGTGVGQATVRSAGSTEEQEEVEK